MNIFKLKRYDTTFISDVKYGEANGKKLLLDICMPKGCEELLPVIMYIHGGGWKYGDKAAAGGQHNAKFAEFGFFTCSINHRSTSEAPHPAQIHDVKAAVRWLRANAAEYNIDPNKIGVWGHSSGGHLAALLGTSYDIPELEGESGNPGFSSRVQAVCTSAGPTDLLQMGGWHDAPNSPEASLVGAKYHRDRPDVATELNPITHIRHDAPPFLIVHGDLDEIVPVNQANLLFDALSDVSYIRVKNGDHDDYNGGGMTMEEILPAILAFFTKHLKGTRASVAEVEAKREAMRRGIRHYEEKLETVIRNS